MPHLGRRRSVDSSSSSSSSSSSDSASKKKHHSDKKHRDKKHHHEEEADHNRSLLGNLLHVPTTVPMMGNAHQHPVNEHPPAYTAPYRPPPSGDRLALTTEAPFPTDRTGYPVSYDLDGRSPIFVGSAIFATSVHPCKIVSSLTPPCRVPYGGGEHEHHGRYDLLPFQPQMMEWVPAFNGHIPQGRQPIDGGYEDHGAKLYHALAQVSGVMVPGKTGVHLGGCNVAFGGGEHVITQGYYILCWK